MTKALFGPIENEEGKALRVILQGHDTDDPALIQADLGDVTPEEAYNVRFEWVDSYLNGDVQCAILDDPAAWKMTVDFLKHFGMAEDSEED